MTTTTARSIASRRKINKQKTPGGDPKMKKSVRAGKAIGAISAIGAIAASLLAPSAMAQSQVTIYGLIDTGVEYVTNANAAGNSVVKMPSLTGSFPSRIGFKGTEDLGGGLQAMFVLEAGM